MWQITNISSYMHDDMRPSYGFKITKFSSRAENQHVIKSDSYKLSRRNTGFSRRDLKLICPMRPFFIRSPVLIAELSFQSAESDRPLERTMTDNMNGKKHY